MVGVVVVVSSAVAGCAGAGGSCFQAVVEEEGVGRVCRVVARVVVERDRVIGMIVATNSNRKTQSINSVVSSEELLLNCPPTHCLSSPLPVSRSQLDCQTSGSLP